MATKTAYKDQEYSMDIGFAADKILSNVVQDLHKYNCKENKWFYNPLKEGAFGFDNLAISIIYTLEKVKTQEKLKKISIDKLSDYVHRAWSKNYIYWRDNEPWINGKYIKPAKTLNDKNRNKLAETDYDELPEEEKEKDRIIARFIKKNFSES